MTFDEYIQNPMGIKNAVFSNREMYRTLYTEKLNKILVRESGKVVYYLYKSKSKYYAYIKVPSELIKDFYYDVVIEFSEPKEGTKITDRTLKNYEAKFYSNDPSFVFTFAHAFIKNDLFIPSLKDKMSKEAVKKNANVKNPNNQIGYVKSLFFAYLIMTQRGLFNKIQYMESYNEKNLKSMITDADKKVSLRIEAQNNLSKKNRKEKQELKKLQQDRKNTKQEAPIKHKVNDVVHTRTVKKIDNSKSIKRSKTSKVVGRR